MSRAGLQLSVAFLLSIVCARAQVIFSDFSVNDETWTSFYSGGVTVSYSSNGGVGGSGAIILNDVANGRDDYFSAPSKFLGNMTAYYNGTLSFDLLLSPNWSTTYSSAVVILTGTYNSSPLSIGYVPSVAQYPNATTFTTMTFTLNPTAGTGWYVTDSFDQITATAASTAQMQAVLGSLSALRIWGDWTTSTDRDVLDNVTLTAVPETSTFAWASALGAAGVVAALRRKRAARASAG